MKFPRSLGRRLATVPHRFDGLHAIRLTELGMARLGTDAHPSHEPARLEAAQGLAFAPSQIVAVADDEHGLRLRIAFLGLTGPLGVLPQGYSELVQKADRLRNRALSAFLDMFNHRLASLFVRASEKYRLSLLVQRAATEAPRDIPASSASAGDDPVSAAMLALAGFGTAHLRHRMAIEDEVVLFYAGIFAARSRPPGALQAMLSDYLGMDVRIDQFSGRWMNMAEDEQTRLPRSGTPARFAILGVDAVVGSRTWDVQGNFRVVVGPVDSVGMRALMPNQPGLRKLVDLIRAYVRDDFGFEVQVVLRRDCVPKLSLGDADALDAPRLGWNTWALGLPALGDKDDIILDPDLVMSDMRYEGDHSRAGRQGDRTTGASAPPRVSALMNQFTRERL